jgi:hypothetical protein
MTILIKKFKNIRTQYLAGWSSGNNAGTVSGMCLMDLARALLFRLNFVVFQANAGLAPSLPHDHFQTVILYLPSVFLPSFRVTYNTDNILK